MLRRQEAPANAKRWTITEMKAQIRCSFCMGWSNGYMCLTCRVNDVDKVVEMGVKMDVRMEKQKF